MPDATDLDTGDCRASAIINTSGNASTPRVVIPVHMTVSPAAGVEGEGSKPLIYRLHQNYPNPSNPISQSGFRIAKWGMVELTVFDMLGREIATLVNEMKEPATHTVQWNASGVSRGVYFYHPEVRGLHSDEEEEDSVIVALEDM